MRWLSCLLICAAALASEVRIRSSIDGTEEPAVLYIPPDAVRGGTRAAPLLVCLHSWSTDYKTAEYAEDILRECIRRGWIYLSPNFRGKNNRPQACASTLAVQDVLDAVRYAKDHARVEEGGAYLVGGSGGGHMALIMAARAPEAWRAVSAWVPITDLTAWHEFSKRSNFRYSTMLEQCCGGPPGTSATDAEYQKRSPLSTLARARSLPVAIDSGIRDGHDGAAVPLSHSLRAFNTLAEANGYRDRVLSGQDIQVMTQEARIPDHLARETVDEPGRRHKVLFRRVAGPVRLTVFDGGHVLDPGAAVNWLASVSSVGHRP